MREQMPGRNEVEMHLDLDQFAKLPARDRIRDRQHHRRIAELKIDRGGQPARAAHVADGGGGGEIEPHRLLQQHRRALGRAERSEEHTSELQSLMRISYAVFCLKKTNNDTNTHAPTT